MKESAEVAFGLRERLGNYNLAPCHGNCGDSSTFSQAGKPSNSNDSLNAQNLTATG